MGQKVRYEVGGGSGLITIEGGCICMTEMSTRGLPHHLGSFLGTPDTTRGLPGRARKVVWNKKHALITGILEKRKVVRQHALKRRKARVRVQGEAQSRPISAQALSASKIKDVFFSRQATALEQVNRGLAQGAAERRVHGGLDD